MSDLTTTNVLLAIMAAVSLLEALAIVGLFVGGILLYRHALRVIRDIDERHIAPIAHQMKVILEDLHTVTSEVKNEARRVDRLLRWAVNIWQRVRGNVERQV
jgi:hypothetical protein